MNKRNTYILYFLFFKNLTFFLSSLFHGDVPYEGRVAVLFTASESPLYEGGA